MPYARRIAFPADGRPAIAPQLEWDNVVDLTLGEVELFMAGTETKSRDGVEIFAMLETIISADVLNAEGITNCCHFEGRVT